MALTTSLVSYWTLNEASGSRADSVGSNTLTDNNTVASAAGKVGNAADFEADNSEYLSHTDNADLSTGDIDFSFQAWVQLESKPGGQMVVAGKHDAATVAGSEWLLSWNNTTDRFQLEVYSGPSTSTSVTASNFGAPSTGTWYLIHAWHDSVNNLIGISVNAGTANTASHSAGVNDTATAFAIGAIVHSVAGAVLCWDGLIDEAGWWKKVLTSQERTDLYNGGAGLAYPFTTPAGMVHRRRHRRTLVRM